MQSPTNEEVVFVKKFPRYEDTFCLGIQERSRSLQLPSHNNTEQQRQPQPDPDWVMPVPDAVTPCKGYDTCIHMQCGKCYDPYLGAHTTCGKMTYFDCSISLPMECQPLKCTESDVNEVCFRDILGWDRLFNLVLSSTDFPHRKIRQCKIGQ